MLLIYSCYILLYLVFRICIHLSVQLALFIELAVLQMKIYIHLACSLSVGDGSIALSTISMHITHERAWNVKDESVDACTCGDWLISLGLERVSRSRIWEGLYIERERPHMCIWNVSRINLFKY